MFVLELSKPSGICLAAMRRDRLVGYLVCSRYDEVWHLMNVAVDPGERRKGIATVLMERLFEQADRRDERYTLEVRPSNAPAIAMYERFDFSRGGMRRGYYQDNKEDALIMWRTAPGPYRPAAEGARAPAGNGASADGGAAVPGDLAGDARAGA
jgi:ribosomal-protein-alanine N-acetyltransferase